jgi:hypothetical protein
MPTTFHCVPSVRGRSWARVLFPLTAGFVGGCAPSLATLQPAHVAPKGHIQAAAGFEVGVPTGTIATVVDVGQSLGRQARTRMLTDAEVIQIFDAGVSWASSPPSVGQHFALAYTLVDRTEIEIRYAGGGWRLGGRYQALDHSSAPFDMVVGFGIARSTVGVPLGDQIPYLTVRDFNRWTFDLPVLIGTSRDWFRTWAGPRVLYSRFDAGFTATLPMNRVETATLEGHALYLGGQGGVAVGYRYVFIGLELTLARLFGSATASTTVSVPAHPTDISGLVVYPAVAIMAEF